MQYHELIIITNRPFLGSTIASPGKPSSYLQVAHTLCFDAANAIVQLLQTNRRQYSLRRTNLHMVHIVFTASLMLVYFSCISRFAEAKLVLANLRICTQALAEMSQAFQSASRALEVIMVVKSRWQTQLRESRRAKRRRDDDGPETRFPKLRNINQNQVSLHQVSQSITESQAAGSQVDSGEMDSMWFQPDWSFGGETLWMDGIYQNSLESMESTEK